MNLPGDYLYRLPGQPVRHPGKIALVCFALALAVLCWHCGSGITGVTGPSSGDPREEHVIAETARFASLLGVNVRGVVTDQEYLVPALHPLYPGEKVPAAGWYKDGEAYYWRPEVLRRTLAQGSALAAHETAHSLFKDEAGANACAALLLDGRMCR